MIYDIQKFKNVLSNSILNLGFFEGLVQLSKKDNSSVLQVFIVKHTYFHVHLSKAQMQILFTKQNMADIILANS